MEEHQEDTAVSASPPRSSSTSPQRRVGKPRGSPIRPRVKRDPPPVVEAAVTAEPPLEDGDEQQPAADGGSGFSFLADSAPADPVPQEEDGSRQRGFSFLTNGSSHEPPQGDASIAPAPAAQGESIWDIIGGATPPAASDGPPPDPSGSGDAGFWFLQGGGAAGKLAAAASAEGVLVDGEQPSSFSSFLDGGGDAPVEQDADGTGSHKQGDSGSGITSLSAMLEGSSAADQPTSDPVSLSAFLDAGSGVAPGSPASTRAPSGNEQATLSAFLEGSAPAPADQEPVSLSAFLESGAAAPGSSPGSSSSLNMFSSLNAAGASAEQPPALTPQAVTPPARKGVRTRATAASSFVPATQLKPATSKGGLVSAPSTPAPLPPFSTASGNPAAPSAVPLTSSLDNSPLFPQSTEPMLLARSSSLTTVAPPAVAVSAAATASPTSGTSSTSADLTMLAISQQLEKQKEAFEEFKSRELTRIAALDALAKEKDKRVEELTMKLARERQAAADELTAASMKEAEVQAKLQQAEKAIAEFDLKKAKWEQRLAKYEADKEVLDEEKKKMEDQREASEQMQAKSEENEFLVQDLQLQLTTKEREWEKKLAEKVKIITEEMDKARRMHELQERQLKMQVTQAKEGTHKAAEEQRKKEVDTLRKDHEAVMKKKEDAWRTENEANKKELEALKIELEKETKRALNPTFAPEASLEIRSLREELDRAQELFEQEKKQIHARHVEEKEIEKQHQAFREEQHRVLVEENKRLEEKFEQMEEQNKHLEHAKLDFERKTAELEVAKSKAGADVAQRVQVERKKMEAEFATRLEKSGAAVLNAECDKLRKSIAAVKAELEASKGEVNAMRQQLGQEKAAAHESERLLKIQMDTLRAELATKEKQGADADVIYLKNTMLKFLQSEQKEQLQSMPVLMSLFKISPTEAKELDASLRKRGYWK